MADLSSQRERGMDCVIIVIIAFLPTAPRKQFQGVAVVGLDVCSGQQLSSRAVMSAPCGCIRPSLRGFAVSRKPSPIQACSSTVHGKHCSWTWVVLGCVAVQAPAVSTLTGPVVELRLSYITTALVGIWRSYGPVKMYLAMCRCR